MKNKVFQIFSVSVFSLLLAVGANKSVGTEVHAVTKEVRKATHKTDIRIDHFYYYGNGAVRSINNKAGSTYNFTEDTFANTVSGYADKLLGEVNYDDTKEVWEKTGADNLSFLNTVLQMPAQSQRWYTNYSDEKLKELKLTPESARKTSEAGDVSNLVETGEVSTSELVASLSYLIDKDYYTLPQNIRVVKSSGGSPLTAAVTKVQNAYQWYYAKDSNGNLNKMKKSDLVMTLSKIFCGVQNSSAIVLKDNSERGGSIWNSKDITSVASGLGDYSTSFDGKNGSSYYGKTYNTYGYLPDGTVIDGYDYFGVQFTGDYWVYYDPNVYELYLSQALHDGIITLTDLDASSSFRKDYKSKSTGNWNSGEVWLDSSIQQDSLGYSKSIAYNGHRLQIVQEAPRYFGAKENMTMMEALRLIEAYMRANDENMSETEENIVRYKLGLSALSGLDSSDRSTITYLIARGILDGNSSYLSSILYDDATISRIYPILYRVANKSARSDFCTVQLTDSETFWASEDFSHNTFSVFVPSEHVIHELKDVKKLGERKDNDKNTVEVEDDFTYADNNGISILGNLKAAVVPEPVYAAKSKTKENSPTSDSGVSDYLVTMYFDKEGVYCIGNTTISQLVKASKTELEKYGIKSIKTVVIENNGKKTEVYEAQFSIAATSQENAVTAVNNKIKLRADLDKYKKTITGVTQISSNGKMTNLVSQKSLKQSFSNITVLEDKVLMNSQTGTLAYFSYDNKLAIVGSQIIQSNYSCITKTGNEVFYDLEAILPLLSSAYVDTIGTQVSIVKTDLDHLKTAKITTSRTDADDYLLNAQYVKMLTHKISGTDDDSDDTLGVACIYTKDAKKQADLDAGVTATTEFYLKLNTLSNVANSLTKSFSIDYNGTSITGTVIVDLQYVVPNENDFSDWLNDQIESSRILTYNDAARMLFTPPDKLNEIPGYESDNLAYAKNSLLSSWWYSNYGMSNALCNWMYGTQAKVYVPSGYVCPSVTLLIDNIGKKTFTAWCNSKNEKGAADSVRDAVLAKIFEDFELGGSYTKYNCGETGKIWINYFQCDTDSPDFKKLGFSSVNSSLTSLIKGGRTFKVYQESSVNSRNSYKIGKLANDQKLKVYGTRYVKSSSGCIYQRVDSIGNPDKPIFKCIRKNKGEANESIKELLLQSRTVDAIEPSNGQLVISDGKSVRNGGSATDSNEMHYETVFARSLFSSETLNPGCFKLSLKEKSGSSPYTLTFNGAGLDNGSFIDMYASQSNKVLGNNTPADATKSEWKNRLGVWLTSPSASILADPSKVNSAKCLSSIFGTKEVYIYTDSYTSKKGLECGLFPEGKIYRWTGKKLEKITGGTNEERNLQQLTDSNTPVYALGRYYVPSDQSYFKKSSNGSITLSGGALSKALNYMQYDMTSLNNQLIDAYLTEQQGTVSVDNLPKGTELAIGDTVWKKSGEWWQSAPIKDLSSIRAVASKPKNLTSYMNKLFGGLFVTVQGKQYPVSGYVKSSQLGIVVGTEKQLSGGLLYADGNSARIRKVSSDRNVKDSTAKSATSASYMSIRCKFDKSLLARPIDAYGTKYTVVSHSGVAMITSADFPFFDADASWSKTKKSMYSVASTSFKPSPSYSLSKKGFLYEFRLLIREDSWNLAWFLVLLLSAYLMVMSWFSYCVLTLGVCKAGFQALAIPNGVTGRNGFDLIKIATFGLYNIDKEVTLNRVIMVSLGCCTIILVIMLIMF